MPHSSNRNHAKVRHALNKKNAVGATASTTRPSTIISVSTKSTRTSSSSAGPSQVGTFPSSTFSFQSSLPTIAENACPRRPSVASVSGQARVPGPACGAPAMTGPSTSSLFFYARSPSPTPSTSSAATLSSATAFSAHSPSPAPSTSSSTTCVSRSRPPSKKTVTVAETIPPLFGRRIQVVFPREDAEHIAPYVSLPGMPLSRTSPSLFQTNWSQWVPFTTYAETRATWYLFVSTIRSMMTDSFKGVPKKYRVWVADKLASHDAYVAYLEVYGLSVPEDKTPFKTFYSVLRAIMKAHGRDVMYRWVYTFVRYLATQELHRIGALRDLPEDLLAQVSAPLPDGWAPPVESLMLVLDQPFIMGPMAAPERQKIMLDRVPYLYQYKYFIGDEDVIDAGVD